VNSIGIFWIGIVLPGLGILAYLLIEYLNHKNGGHNHDEFGAFLIFMLAFGFVLSACVLAARGILHLLGPGGAA
jgi:hypothetical protein